MDLYFPELASRAAVSNAEWKEKTKGAVEMMFPYFFSSTLNIPADGKTSTVMSKPHRDWKNTAAGMCAVYIYGFCFAYCSG